MPGDIPSEMVCQPAHQALRIAVVYSRVPFPMMRGDQLTVAHLLAYFHARGHVVDLFTLATGGKTDARQEAWLNATCRKLHAFSHGALTSLFGILTALVKGWPLQVGVFSNASLARHVAAAVKSGEYDVVYNYYLRTAYAVPAIFSPNRATNLGKRPAVAFLAMQLSQTLNTRRIFQNERNWVKRLLYRFECGRVSNYEAKIWQQYTKTVLIGSRDLDAIRSACRSANQPEISNWTLCAHGTDVRRFNVALKDEIVPERVVFSGSMRYQPNVQAAHWFIENCWEAIRARIPNAQLYIVGQLPAKSLRSLHGRNGVWITGTVPDIGAHIRKAAVCVNPVRAAGGMQNKLIEYMACGKAVVATSVANEGIGAPETVLRIADDASDFAQKTIDLLSDISEARRLGEAARDYVVREWTWESQFEKLERAFFDALLDPSSGKTPLRRREVT